MDDNERLDIEQFILQHPKMCDSYVPVAIIGEGTFSTVYKAVDVHSREMEGNLSDWNEQKPTGSDIIDQALKRVNAFGSVQYVALKRVTPTSSPDRVVDEIEFLEQLHGEHNIVGLIDVQRFEDQIIMVLPYVAHEDFREYLLQMTVGDIQGYMRALLEAVAHMHACDVMHRDIKPTNFLYSLKTQKGVLVDFGLAQKYESANNSALKPIGKENASENIAPPVSSTKQTITIDPRKDLKQEFLFPRARKSTAAGQSLFFSSQLTTSRTVAAGYTIGDDRPQMKANRAGTRGFRAPEVLFKKKHQLPAIDVWSCGVILLNLFCAVYPFFQATDDLDATYEMTLVFGLTEMKRCAQFYGKKLKMGLAPVNLDALNLEKIQKQFNRELLVPNEGFDLLRKLLCLKDTERITAADALNHSFLAK